LNIPSRAPPDSGRARSSSTRLVRPVHVPEQRTQSRGVGSVAPTRVAGIPMSMLQSQPQTRRSSSRSRSVTPTPRSTIGSGRLTPTVAAPELRPKVSLGARVAATESVLAASLQAAARRQAAGAAASGASKLSGQHAPTLRQRLHQAGLQQDLESLKAGLQHERQEKRSLTERVEALTRARTVGGGVPERPCPSIAAALEPKLSKKVAFSFESTGASTEEEGSEDLRSQARAGGPTRVADDRRQAVRADDNGCYCNGCLESPPSSVQTVDSPQDPHNSMADCRATSADGRDSHRRKLGTKRRDFTMRQVIEELAQDLGLSTVPSRERREEEQRPLPSLSTQLQENQYSVDESVPRPLAARVESIARARAAAAVISGDLRDAGDQRQAAMSPMPRGMPASPPHAEEFGLHLGPAPDSSSKRDCPEWTGSSAGKEMSASPEATNAFHDVNSSLTSVQTLSEDGAGTSRPLIASSPCQKPTFVSEVLDDLGRDLGLSSERTEQANAEQFTRARPLGQHEQRSLAARVEALARVRAAAGQGVNSDLGNQDSSESVLLEHRASKKVVFAAREAEVCALEPPSMESCASWSSASMQEEEASRLAEIYMGGAALHPGCAFGGAGMLSDEVEQGLQD